MRNCTSQTFWRSDNPYILTGIAAERRQNKSHKTMFCFVIATVLAVSYIATVSSV